MIIHNGTPADPAVAASCAAGYMAGVPFGMYTFTPYPRYVGYLGLPGLCEPPAPACRTLASLTTEDREALIVEYLDIYQHTIPQPPTPEAPQYQPPAGYDVYHAAPQPYHQPYVPEPLPLPAAPKYPTALVAKVLTTALHLACLYPILDCLDTPCHRARFFLLLAHYYTTEQQPYAAAPVSSASVGDSSVSYDNTLASRLAGNPFYLWLIKSPYGLQLLTLLRQAALIVI